MNTPSLRGDDGTLVAVYRTERLLLVDADAASLQATRRMLSRWPDQRSATSGHLAIRMAWASEPDLIVIDIDMPRQAGLQLFLELQADARLCRIPVILLSSLRDDALEAITRLGGAADLLPKPLDAALLVSRVAAALSRMPARGRELAA